MPPPSNFANTSSSAVVKSTTTVASRMESNCTFACRLDRKGRVLEIGNGFARVLGYDGECCPKSLFFPNFVALPEERAPLDNAIREGNDIALRDIFETTLKDARDASCIKVRWVISRLNTDEGAPGFIVMGWPEAHWPRLVRQMLNLGRLVEITMQAVAVVSSKGTIEYVNPAFCATTGYSPSDIMGTPVSAIVSVPEDLTIVQEAVACFRRDEMWEGALRLRRKDGSALHLDVRVQPIIADSEGGRRYMAVAMDLSKQQSLERQVEDLQRLESLGTLANGLAHRFNNILAAISGQTELLIMSSKDPEVKQRAERILESALKGKEVVEQLSLFGRRSEPRSRLADLVPVVRNAVRFIRAAQSRCVQIEEDIPESCASVMANTGEIHQVAMNLLTNALEAIGTKQGVIRITVKETLFPLSPSVGAEKCIEIDVKDTGPGIDPEIRPRIFEPFFTTHGLANSSGMGLAATHGIVQRHGGIVLCESELGHGALFRVILPVFNGRRDEPDTVAHSNVAQRPRILFVDKKGFALESGKRVLEDLNYEVVTSSSFDDAAELLADSSQTFRLLITSLKMDDGDGVELSRVSRRSRPDMPILLSASMREKFNEEAALDAGASAILRSPVQREQLADIVGKLMECGK